MRPEWPIVLLGDVLARTDEWILLDPSASYKQLTVRLWGKGVVLRRVAQGSDIGGGRRIRARAGQFVLSRIDARNGAFGLVPGTLDGAVLSNDFPAFDVDHSHMLPQYLSWLSKTKRFIDQCRAVSEGTTNRVRLKEDKFLAIRIPLPPLAEQRRIVGRIEELAGKIRKAIALRATSSNATDAVFPSAINSLFGLPNGRLPDGWRYVEVGELGIKAVETVQTGPFGAQLHKRDFVPVGRPVLAIGNVQWGYLDTNRVDHISEEKARELSRYVLLKGDVLFTRSGTVGRSAVVPSEADGWLMTGHILRIRVDIEQCDPWYLFYGFRGSRVIQDQVQGSTRGATRAGFNTTLLSRVKLPLPPIEHQKRIVAYLESLRNRIAFLEDLQASSSAELGALLPSILDKAFSGGL